MSHLRNLFHKAPGQMPVPSSSAASVAEAPEFTGRHSISKEFAPALTPTPHLIKPPVLADFAVEETRIHTENRLVSYSDPHSVAADRLRYIRMRLREPWSAGKLKRLLVTSALAHDGKSTVILNLATTLSERGRRSVLLVDADLHKSSLAEKLGLKAWAGLAECLHGGTDAMSAIRRIDPLGWHLLPAGEPPSNPTELLQAPGFRSVMERVSSHFDWVLIDSPPTLHLTDAISLQQHADAALLVVRAGATPREAVDQCVALLGAKNIAGIVLNGVEARKHLYTNYSSSSE
jgi:capsular exopolysaccharide synthesis family protein